MPHLIGHRVVPKRSFLPNSGTAIPLKPLNSNGTGENLAIHPSKREILALRVTVLIMNELLASVVQGIGDLSHKIVIGASLAPNLHYL